MNVWGIVTFILSMASFVAGIAMFAINSNRRLTRRLLLLTIAIIAAILFIRLTFSACGLTHLSPSVFTEIMQTFSLDADYGILNEMYAALGGSGMALVMVIYATLLYTLAPIAGGAIVYDVLAGVSPSIRLWFIRTRPMYVFSQINEASVTLAEDIARRFSGKQRIALLFMDAVPPADDEGDLVLRIKEIGAICLEEDMTRGHWFRRSERCSLLLMDAEGNDFDDAKNLEKLDALLHGANGFVWDPRRGANVLFFTENSDIIEYVRAIKEQYDEKQPGGDVSLNVVRAYAQTCCAHLRQVPLYGPLGDFKPGKPLRVVLFGDSAMAREMFKTVFWCGQMLDTPLSIAVISPSADAKGVSLEDDLNHLNPEILESCTAFRTDGGVPADCLRIWPDREGKEAFSPPYCSLDFIDAKAAEVDLQAFLSVKRRCKYGTEESYRLLDGDYFIIMGDHDEANLALADDLRRCLIRAAHFEAGRPARPGKAEPWISMEIHSDALCRIIEQRFSGSMKTARMIPFGSYRSRYSWDNVFLDESFLAERAADSASSQSDPALHGFADINKTHDSIYDSWANLGRLFHLPYKQYFLNGSEGATHARTVHRLIWLEHRRWCAFWRVQGFRRPFGNPGELLDALTADGADGTKTPRCLAYKDISARTHPCLVECAETDTGATAWLEANLSGHAKLSVRNLRGHDLLDVISWVRTSMEGDVRDLKAYDLDEAESLLIHRSDPSE